MTPNFFFSYPSPVSSIILCIIYFFFFLLWHLDLCTCRVEDGNGAQTDGEAKEKFLISIIKYVGLFVDLYNTVDYINVAFVAKA